MASALPVVWPTKTEGILIPVMFSADICSVIEYGFKQIIFRPEHLCVITYPSHRLHYCKQSQQNNSHSGPLVSYAQRRIRHYKRFELGRTEVFISTTYSLPRYKCHKFGWGWVFQVRWSVQAITTVIRAPSGNHIHFETIWRQIGTELSWQIIELLDQLWVNNIRWA